MSGDPEQEYFSNGISEDIITELARYPNLFVIAPHSSFSFKESNPDIHKIGQELGVQYVVNGSVRRAEKRVRITAQIQEAKTGKLMWGDRYDRELDSLFTVQDEVTRSIVAALAIRIESETLERAKRKHPGDMGAYDFWLRGKDVLERANNVEGVENAQVLFRKGLAFDSDYARLHAGLAEAAYSRAFFRAGPDFLEAAAVATRHAETAIRLDDTDTQPHRVAGWVYMFSREFERAQRHFDTAITINASDADVLMNWACATALLGQPDDAIEKGTIAMHLNPHHPGWYREFMTIIFFSARRYADALSIAASEPDVFPSSPGWRAAASAYIGRDEDAKRFAGELVSRITSDWIGDRAASSRDIVEYLCKVVPFRREEDADHLREGLFLAGLDR
jgi:TolB-like protein